MENEKSERSAWVKGGVRLGLLVIVLAGIYVGMPQARPYVIATVWFVLVSVVIGVVMAGIIHWWNERRPVTLEDEEGIRLNLNDEKQGRAGERDQ
jgi:hypothetical protein